MIYVALAITFVLAIIFGADYVYQQTMVGMNAEGDQHSSIAPAAEVPMQTNLLNKVDQQLINIPFNDYKVIEKTPPHFMPGFDWSLPASVKQESYSGLIAEDPNSPPAAKNSFLIVRWDESNPQPNQFDFRRFEKDFKRVAPKSVLVRLEVNSQCEAPKWALDKILISSEKSLIFWDKNYIELTRPFIQEFARKYASNPRIIGVQLGLADGEFRGSCDDYDNKDGWGEFWMSPQAIKEAEAKFGFNPDVFESSAKANIDLYINAFGDHVNKLAFTNFGPLFTYGERSQKYNDKMLKIAQYSIAKGLGNRDGEIERWMSYTDKIYGSVIASMPDNSCRLDFDEDYAEKISGRYWGTENEFYGNKDYVIAVHGDYLNQPYRFLLSSLRSLQMRRNFMSISNDLNSIDHPVYKTQEFLQYLTKTLGKQIENTPDAFVVMGERYISAFRLEDHKDAECVRKNDDKIPIRSFGRWLTESPQNTLVKNAPAIKTRMKAEDHYWGQEYYLPEGIDYEYFAREAQQFSFDLNDQLAKTRCKNDCVVEIKATFKDTLKTALNVYVAEGKSLPFETKGDNQIKTVSFKIRSAFKNGIGESDIIFKSDQGVIPLILLRVNFLTL